jgi:hypothetical protein
VPQSIAESGTLSAINSCSTPDLENSQATVQSLLPKTHQMPSASQEIQVPPSLNQGYAPHNTQLSSLNSLAEVGVGIALAYALFDRVRDFWKMFFEKVWESKHDEAKSVVLDTPELAINEQSIKIKFDAIHNAYDKSELTMQKIQQRYSFTILLILVTFLGSSPFYNVQIGVWQGIYGIFFVMSPFLFAFLYSLALFIIFSIRLWRLVRRYHTVKETLDELIMDQEIELVRPVSVKKHP